MRSLKDVLTPQFLARTKLPRNSPGYLTQRQAFQLQRWCRLRALAREAPDLFERLRLPDGSPDKINTSRAYAILRGRK
jgi:hypothetical protein